MILYTKEVSPKGKVSYKEYITPQNEMYELESDVIITLLSSLTICMLMSVEQILPDHSRIAREMKNVEQAVVKMAKLVGAPLDDKLVNVGVAAWNQAIHSMQKGLMGQ